MITHPHRTSRLLVAGHLGLGDHILCKGIYRSLAEGHDRIWVAVKRRNSDAVRAMLMDVPNVALYVLEDRFAERQLRASATVMRSLGATVLGLGVYGHDFLSQGSLVNYDENFYLQAGVPFDLRWSAFHHWRALDGGKHILEHFGLDERPYVFIHEDVQRGFKVDEDLLPSGLARFRPPVGRHASPFFSYGPVLEAATEVHCIESSFAALADSIDIRGSMYIHRYARPETRLDPRLAFTYRGQWTVYE